MYRSNNVAVGPGRPPQDKYERFEQWLKDNGAQFELVGFATTNAKVVVFVQVLSI